MEIDLSAMHYKNRVRMIIGCFAVLRIIAASYIGFGNDESYYWVFSKHLQWNYFDHPPGVALLARFFSANLLLQEPLFLRLGSIVCCACSAWFIFKCVTLIKNERAGWYAACLYTASCYAGITAGILLMPDSPQMFFWTASMWMITKIIYEEDNLLNWILFGIAAGCCIMCKIHGIFIWFGVGAYTIFQRRNWLGSARFWAAVFVSALIISPIVFWNIQHDFITYRFHSERVLPVGHAVTYMGLLREICGELVVNNPVNVLLIIAALFVSRRGETTSGALRIYAFTGLSFIACLLFMAFFRKTLPHWSGPAYVALLPCAAVYLSERKHTAFIRLLPAVSLGVYVFCLAGCMFFILLYPGTTGSRDENNYGKGDITLDAYGWDKAGNEFLKIRAQDIAAGRMKKNSPLVCDSWWGAHDEYYFCRPAEIEMIALGDLHQIHQYFWLNHERIPKADSSTAYCIVHSYDRFDAVSAFGQYYATADTAAVIPVYRGSKKAAEFTILRLRK